MTHRKKIVLVDAKSAPDSKLIDRSKKSEVKKKRARDHRPSGLLALVRFPPNEITDARRHAEIVHEGEIPDLKGVLIAGRLRSFLETKNPVLAIEAFCLSVDAGVYPPLNILDWLREIFGKYHKAQGKETMDSCMGLIKQKAGAFKQLMIQSFHSDLCHNISMLRAIGVPKTHAISMVIRWVESSPQWNQTKFSFVLPAHETLDKIYKQSIFASDETVQLNRELMESWSVEMKRNFIEKFPADQLPVNVREKMKLLCNA